MLGDDDMDAVFHALAHKGRRRMLDTVKGNPGIGVGALASGFDVSRIAVMKHLGILQEAGLLISEKHGRVRRLWFNAVPIQMIHDRWTTEYSAYWSASLTDLKLRAEQRAQHEPSDDKKRRK